VIDPYTRHPALLAQATATIAEMAPKRFRVIMGSGSHFETLPGYGSPKPVAGLREAADLMQRIVRGREGHARRRGDQVQGWCARLEADRGPAALYREPRAADPQARGIDRRRRADRQLRHAAGHRLCQGAHPAGLAASKREWKDIRLCSWIYLSVLERADDPCRRASSAG
jgi:hypothetical protein